MTEPVSLEALRHPDGLRPLLERHGLQPRGAREKAELFRQAATALRDERADDTAPVSALFVPGRIEVVGKHVDYAGGHSLTCALDRGFCMVTRPRADRTVRLVRADGQGEAHFQLASDLTPQPGDWTNYPMTVARRMARNFDAAQRGADIAFISDLPAAAGLSSSSALVTAMFFALARCNALEDDATYQRELGDFGALAGYLGAIENGATVGQLAGDTGVGTFGGSQDHTAIIGSRAGQLGQFAYCPVQLERYIELPAQATFVIGVSGAEAVKTGAAQQQYNDAATLAAQAAEQWRETTGGHEARLADIVRGASDAADRLRAMLADQPALLRRFEHFYAENEQIVPQVAEALQRGDMHAVGESADRSQRLAEQWLGNQVEQTMHLARAARRLGAAAASAFGAGFGGSVWAMVRPAQVESFIDAWRADYAEAMPDAAAHSTFFHAQAGPAAFELGRGPLASAV